MTDPMKGYDEWLWAQCDAHMDRGEEHDEELAESDDCECNECRQKRWQAYQDDKAEQMYEEMRLEGRTA